MTDESQQDPEQTGNENPEGEQSDEDFVREIEEDPSTAGGPEEPGEELRGG